MSDFFHWKKCVWGKRDLAWRQRHVLYVVSLWFYDFCSAIWDVKCLSMFICVHDWMKWNAISFVFFRAFVLVACVSVDGHYFGRKWAWQMLVSLWKHGDSVVRSQSTVMQKNKRFSTRFCLKPNSLRAQPPFSPFALPRHTFLLRSRPSA